MGVSRTLARVLPPANLPPASPTSEKGFAARGPPGSPPQNIVDSSVYSRSRFTGVAVYAAPPVASASVSSAARS